MKKTILLGLSTISVFLLASCASSSSPMANNSLFNSSQPSDRQNVTMYSLNDPQFWQGGQSTIWARLQQTGLDKLQAGQNTTDTTQAGWIKLAIISKRNSTNTTDLIHQLEDWRAQNGSHPANTLFPSNDALNSYATIAPPKHIALLLPLSGKLGASGNAVRNGFMNSYYASKGSADQTVAFYDTGLNPNVNALYAEAISKGADTVLGPLTKEEAKQLLSNSGLSVPTIELNYTDGWGSLPSNVYQFGLSPIDESKQVANKAIQSGYTHALIIAPQNDWGQKTARSITEKFQSMGGTVVDSYYFASNSNFSADIPKLLHIDPKDDQKMSRDPDKKSDMAQQGRHDYDVIFLLAPPPTARQIVPLLRFYYVNKTPIYATSAVYSGSADPQKNIDLNGVVFCDGPSTLYQGGNRLTSVGHDAYLISRDLWRFKNLPNFPLYGATGEITLNPGNQFHRRLAWAQFHNGSA